LELWTDGWGGSGRRLHGLKVESGDVAVVLGVVVHNPDLVDGRG
jgi:hypothetical protein